MRKNLLKKCQNQSKATAINTIGTSASGSNCTKSLMGNYASKVFLVFGLLLALSLLTGIASAKTIDVGTSGFEYDDISNAIQSASSGDSVHVHSGTYTITSPILMKSGVNVYGDGQNKTIVQVTSGTVCNSDSQPGYIVFNGVTGVELSGMSIVGAATSKTNQHDVAPTNYRNAIAIKGSCSNLKIHDFYMTLLYADGVKVMGSSSISNSQIYNMVMSCDSHDGVQLWNADNVRVYNCWIDTINNCVVRLARSKNIEVDHITGMFGITNTGWTMIEFESTCSNESIHNNVFMHGGDNYWAALCGVNGHSGTIATGSASLYDNIIYDVPMGAQLTSSGFTATLSNNNVTSTWDVNTHGYNPNYADMILPPYNGSSLPVLQSPANGDTTPTINNNLTFQWSSVNSTNYHVQVATDAGFSNITYDRNTTTNAISLGMSDGSYYWRVSAYIDTGASAGSWTSFTASNSFTVSGNIESTGGLYGIIYDTQVGNGIQGAVVTIINSGSNESKVTVTDENGMYSFTDIGSSGIWYMSVAATDYQPTSWQLPTDVSTTYKRKDVALVKSASYFAPNYVTFSVIDTWLNSYSGVTTTVYQNGAVIDTQQTDDFGKVKFKLDPATQYTVTFIDSTQNINTQRTLTPTDDTYWIVVWGANHKEGNVTINDEPAEQPEESDYVIYGVTTADKNLSYSYIVVGINSTSSASNIKYWTTTVTEVYKENYTVVRDLSNTTLNYSTTVSGFGNSTTQIEVPRGRTYRVYSEVINNEYADHVYRQDYVTISKSGIDPYFDFGFEDLWNYEALGYACMLLIGGLFGQRNVNVGALLLILMGGFFTSIGWFPTDTGTLLMNGLAILLFLAYSMTRRE